MPCNIHSSFTAMQTILKLLLHNKYVIVIKNSLRKFQKKCINWTKVNVKYFFLQTIQFWIKAVLKKNAWQHSWFYGRYKLAILTFFLPIMHLHLAILTFFLRIVWYKLTIVRNKVRIGRYKLLTFFSQLWLYILQLWLIFLPFWLIFSELCDITSQLCVIKSELWGKKVRLLRLKILNYSK